MDLDRSSLRHARRRDAAARLPWQAWGLVLLAAALTVSASPARAQDPDPSGPTAIDVVFVLDNSGSMKTNDPEFLTRRAVSDFTDALAASTDVDGRVGIVVFDGTVRLVQRLIPAGSIASTRRLERTLAELDFSGQRTDSPSAIERALYELRENGRESARRAIVFLSDGRIDTGDPQRDFDVAAWLREDLAGASREEGVLIFGIAFTESADYQLMQEVARRTDARYYRAFAPGELISVVDDVLERLSEPPAWDLATADMTGRPQGAAGRPDGAPANAPSVAAAPLAEEDGGFDIGLLGWLPVLLLLAGGGLMLRGRLGGGFGPAAAAPAPPAQLLDLGGQIGETGEAFSLSPGRTSIGRDAHNDIVLDHDTISSEHALIEYREGRYWLQDLRSTNGTRRAGERLAPDERVPLKGGDAVRFADVELMFAMKGYVPVGATAYLSSSTVPPLDWSMLADSTQRGDRAAHVAERSAGPDPASSEAPARAEAEAAIDAPSGEVVFAEHRGRLDPASVVDLDEALGDGERQETPDAAPVPEDTFAREAIARAEAVLDDLEREDEHGASASAEPTPPDEPEPPRGGRPTRGGENERDASASAPESPGSAAVPARRGAAGDESEAKSRPTADQPAGVDVGAAEAEPEIDEHDEGAEPASRAVTDDPAEPEPRVETRDGAEAEPHAEADDRAVSESLAGTDERAEPPGAPIDVDEPTTELPIPDVAREAADTRRAAMPDPEEEITVPHALVDADRAESAPGAATEALRRGLDFHLARVAELSPAFAAFVDAAFEEEIREALPIAANDLIEAARTSGEVETRRYTQDGVRFLLCGIDGDMGAARDAFVAAHGGFTRLLMEELQSESFRKERCRILALLTFGQPREAEAEPWVSLSVVPDEGEDPRIDLLSYEFLTEAERQEIEPNLDPEVSQSGLA